MKVNIISTDKQLPKYATEGACCMDLVAVEDTVWEVEYFTQKDWVCVVPGTPRPIKVAVNTATIRTGIKVEVPEGYRLDIYPRSGWGFKHNIQLANGTGKIDSDFRGEIKVKLISTARVGSLPTISAGERIAQMELNPVTKVEWKQVDELSDTERGEGGYGSTGTK